MAGRTPLADLSTTEIDNVYIFLADCVREDYTPASITEQGTSFKTVAAGLCTPQSLPSIVSGRHVPNHGVEWFMHSLPEGAATLFDLPVNTAYTDEVWPGWVLRDAIGGPDEESVKTIEEPFVLLEHDKGGHTPYAGFEGDSASESLAKIPDRTALKTHYRETITESTRRFEDRMATLEDRGLLENTLVVYLSDHGALMGEYGGFVNHGLPAVPETTYVKTVFIHPSLKKRDRDELLHHVDIAPTVAELVTGEPASQRVDGDSLLKQVEIDRPGYTHGIMRPPDRFKGTLLDPGYDAPSVWTRRGGVVVNQTPLHVGAVTAVYDTLLSGNTGALSAGNRLSRLGNGFKFYLGRRQQYGYPDIKERDAVALIEEINSGSVEAAVQEIDEAAKSRLEELGYR